MLSIAMIAAPRRSMTVAQAVAALRVGGFDETVHIFAEPGCVIEQGIDRAVVHANPVRLGGRANWMQAIGWLLANTQTPHLLVVEDDAEYCRNARKILDAQLAREKTYGYLSLFLAANEAFGLGKTGRGWVQTNRTNLWGTVSLCFHRGPLAGLLEYPPLTASPRDAAPYDFLMRRYYRERVDAPCYVHAPSLTEHHGWNETTIGKPLEAPGVRGLRRGYQFDAHYSPD